jgi:hypothetical protein
MGSKTVMQVIYLLVFTSLFFSGRAKARKLLIMGGIMRVLAYNIEWLVLTLFRSAKYSRRTGGGALWSGSDGPRPGAGRSATWHRG